MDINLAAPCGIYCGACRQYLTTKKNQFEKRGLKQECKGCRIRNKKCAFIRKQCPSLLKNEIEFCYECDTFPCDNLDKLDNTYRKKYFMSPIENNKRINEVGVAKWLDEQAILYTCPECKGDISVHDAECFDCGIKDCNPNKNKGGK